MSSSAWFIGWDLLLEYIAIVAVVAIGISGYLGAFLNGFGIELPLAITASAEEGGVVNIPAVVICLLVTFILSLGTKTFGRFELVAVGIKIVLILFIIGLGIFYINTANYNPFMPAGFGPVLTGAATVFFAVFGYDAMSTAAEEAEDGKKHMPKAIILSLIIAMTLYVAATLVLTGMQRYTEIDPEAGFASAFSSVGLPVIASIISVFAVLSILTVMLTFLLGVTRVWFSMSRDGLLPPWFAKVDRHGTPQRVTWIAGVGSAVLAGVFPIREVADLTNIGILSAFIVVCVGRHPLPLHPPRHPPVLPTPMDARGAGLRSPRVAVPHPAAALADLAAVRDLARHRARHLLRIRTQALPAQPRQPTPPERANPADQAVEPHSQSQTVAKWSDSGQITPRPGPGQGHRAVHAQRRPPLSYREPVPRRR